MAGGWQAGGLWEQGRGSYGLGPVQSWALGPAVPPTQAVASGHSGLFSGLPLGTLVPRGPFRRPCSVALWQVWWVGHQRAPFCSVLVSFLAACGHSKNNEDLKQQNSELDEKLRVLVNEKAGMQLRMEELQKKLEMSELLLQQVRLEPQGA